MKERNKNKNEKIADENKLHEALVKCGEACKAFSAAFYDYEMSVDFMPVGVFLNLKEAACDRRYAMKRAAQPKVGDEWKEDVTCKRNYEDEA